MRIVISKQIICSQAFSFLTSGLKMKAPQVLGKWCCVCAGAAKIFYFFYLKADSICNIIRDMTFKSLPFTPRPIKATEARLQAIYDAAKLGLKGDSLALAAGMLPTEFRQLCELDPVAEMAAMKGRADAEKEMAAVLHQAALDGDAKVALEILKHRHDWVAKQQVQVDVSQQISIIDALQRAESRVIDVLAHEVQPDQLKIPDNAKANIHR